MRGAFIKTDYPLFQRKQKLADPYVSREINAGEIITYTLANYKIMMQQWYYF